MGGAAASDASRITYMYTDMHLRFERCVFRGHEWQLCIFEALLFCLCDFLLASRPTIAAIIVFVVSQALAMLRRDLGQRNIARKTLIDEAFLS